MDLALLGRVLWRHKIIVTLGLLAAISLAFLSYAKVSYGPGNRSGSKCVDLTIISKDQKFVG